MLAKANPLRSAFYTCQPTRSHRVPKNTQRDACGALPAARLKAWCEVDMPSAHSGVPVLDIAPFLAAAAASARAASPPAAPVVQPGSAAADVVESWGSAMRDVGLVVVTGHGIADSTFEALHRVSGEFFDMSNDDKNQSFFIGMSQAMMRGGGADASSCRWTWKRLNAPKDGWNGGAGVGAGVTKPAASDSVEVRRNPCPSWLPTAYESVCLSPSHSWLWLPAC